ncbi:MAG: glycerol-3-phosphate 1-O-acyltransferase PlsY [Eubacteriales bacterium]|nr:glycerol-3-phosphate 1-O-acyltransferase PlsY [Eubacteriales bacterium]
MMSDLNVLVLKTILAGLAGYLLGSINTSIIVGKIMGVDIRKKGSGNAGATNTLRTLGKKAAIIVALGDVLKGIIACTAGMLLTGNVENAGNPGLMAGGTCAVVGHNWPLYFGFRGGKGIFTSLAVVMMMDWRIGLILLGIFIIIVALTRYVSLGSVIASLLFPFTAAIKPFSHPPLFLVFAAVIAVLAVVRHSSNIVRLLKGTENKLSFHKK